MLATAAAFPEVVAVVGYVPLEDPAATAAQLAELAGAAAGRRHPQPDPRPGRSRLPAPARREREPGPDRRGRADVRRGVGAAPPPRARARAGRAPSRAADGDRPPLQAADRSRGPRAVVESDRAGGAEPERLRQGLRPLSRARPDRLVDRVDPAVRGPGAGVLRRRPADVRRRLAGLGAGRGLRPGLARASARCSTSWGRPSGRRCCRARRSSSTGSPRRGWLPSAEGDRPGLRPGGRDVSIARTGKSSRRRSGFEQLCAND